MAEFQQLTLLHSERSKLWSFMCSGCNRVYGEALVLINQNLIFFVVDLGNDDFLGNVGKTVAKHLLKIYFSVVGLKIKGFGLLVFFHSQKKKNK